MLDQERAVDALRRNVAPVRLQMTISQSVIRDLRKKKFLGDSAACSREEVGRALMRAALVGIRDTEA
jgi:hypothetical protein